MLSTSSFLSINIKQCNHQLLVLLLLYASLLLTPNFSSPVVDGITLGNRNTNIMCIEHEREALLKFKHGIEEDHCGMLSSWGDHPNCCQWHGVRCNNVTGHVIMLNLSGVHSTNESGVCLEGELGSSVGELKHLKYLDLSTNFFKGEISSQLGNLSSLIFLDLSYNAGLYGKTLSWLSRLTMLKYVNLASLSFSQVTNWLQAVNNLPFLRVLHLELCSLPPLVPRQLSYENSSTTLSFLDLSNNELNDSSIIFGWLFNLSGINAHLIHLDLFANELTGPIPSAFGNLHALSHLDLSWNNFQSLPKTLGGLCRLQELYLKSNNFTDELPYVIQLLFGGCAKKSLSFLDLSDNNIWGSFDPDLVSTFSSLRELGLRNNQLSGRIPQSLGQLSTMEKLDLSSNGLEGNLSSIHFSNLLRLKELWLGNNTGLALHINASWVPPFQLDKIDLSYCRLGPLFPNWLLSQINYSHLDISNVGIYDKIPNSFWNTTPSKLHTLNMSHNKLYGTISNLNKLLLNPDQPAFVEVDLSFNNFEGVIPSFPSNVTSLLLNNNSFSDPIPFLCPKSKSHLSYLDISNNILSAKLPDCWMSFPYLEILHLENNKLYGLIPPSISHLNYLESLHLRNNFISETLPATLLENLTSLVILDLGHNLLSGHIPSSLGTFFKTIAILSLRDNNLNGELPLSLCQMSFLQILDLSSNHIIGKIPKCIYNFTAMQNGQVTLPRMEYHGLVDKIDLSYISLSYSDAATISWKNKEWSFKNTLGLVKAIDISNNKLEGEIPTEFSFLKGLVSLNLSRNNLIGSVSAKLGQLTSLQILDLSRNQLSSEIPTSFAELNSLGILDLSNNQLFGKIPDIPQLQRFDAFSYTGNPRLCGMPLPNCLWDQPHDSNPTRGDSVNHHQDENNDIFTVGLYVSVILGFIIGFWGVCGTLVLKRSWRHAFFQFLDDMRDRYSVKFFSNLARFRRWQ